MRVLALSAVVSVISVGATLAAQSWWMPIHEVRTQAYVDASGRVVPRYQWRANRHEVSGACLVVLFDTVTERFAVTSADAAACGPVIVEGRQ